MVERRKGIPAITPFLNFIDNRYIVRRIVLFVTLWMTWRSFTWAAVFAEQYLAAKIGGGLDVAAIIGAVTGPIAVLQGFVFKAYLENKDGGIA